MRPRTSLVATDIQSDIAHGKQRRESIEEHAESNPFPLLSQKSNIRNRGGGRVCAFVGHCGCPSCMFFF
jgi:hypothetical protein